MCSALEELKMEGKQEGMIAGTVKTCRKFKLDQEATVKNVMEEFSLSEEEAVNYVKKYWQLIYKKNDRRKGVWSFLLLLFTKVYVGNGIPQRITEIRKINQIIAQIGLAI